MTRLLSRAEARAFVETLSSVRNAPETCLSAWLDKAHMRRNALLYDYVELDDGAVIRFARPSIEKLPAGFDGAIEEDLFSTMGLDDFDDQGQRSWERERECFGRGRTAASWHIVRPWIELPKPGSAKGSSLSSSAGAPAPRTTPTTGAISPRGSCAPCTTSMSEGGRRSRSGCRAVGHNARAT